MISVVVEVTQDSDNSEDDMTSTQDRKVLVSQRHVSSTRIIVRSIPNELSLRGAVWFKRLQAVSFPTHSLSGVLICAAYLR
jgi:hypothetical protein